MYQTNNPIIEHKVGLLNLAEKLHIARRLNFDYSICIKNRSSIVHPVSIFLRLA
ncbi:hypothetical protein [Candidatus Arsenophonus triatominarum]|uniref:hypothetical protein n=1 Tax=Candidatus Arsenophonus triatominarum TaxID=57911 RepID=UPI00164F555E|nr:hypothetical protein [Candidatus Arsenophonus triatominarum]